MADIKKVMEKLNSQKSTKEAELPKKLPPLPKLPKKAVSREVEEPEEDFDEVEEEEVEEPEESQEQSEKEVVEGTDVQSTINSEIERLQNNGVFRAELLYQLIEINTNLKVLNALILKAIGGEDDGKPK
jgi:hypothetical protein